MNPNRFWRYQPFPFKGKFTNEPKYLTNISHKYHDQSTNTLIIYNISHHSLKQVKIVMKYSDQPVFETVIDDLPYRGSVEVLINRINNKVADLYVFIMVGDHLDKYLLKQDVNISRNI